MNPIFHSAHSADNIEALTTTGILDSDAAPIALVLTTGAGARFATAIGPTGKGYVTLALAAETEMGGTAVVETFEYNAVATDTITLSARALGGTTAQTWPVGSKCRVAFSTAHLEELQNLIPTPLGQSSKFLTTTDGINITWATPPSAATYLAGDGILLTGSTFSVKLTDATLQESGSGLSLMAVGTGQIIAGNAGVGAAVTLSGDATISNTGVITIGAGAIGTSKLATVGTPGTYALVNSITTNAAGQVTAVTTGGTGEANTASNVGAAGVGLYLSKSGVALQFKNIAPGSTRIAVANDVGNSDVTIDVVEANCNVGNMTGTLNLANGGTGGTTATTAINNLLPSQVGANGLVLGSNGTNTAWVAAPSAGNLVGPVTSVGLTTTITAGSITNAMLTGVISLAHGGLGNTTGPQAWPYVQKTANYVMAATDSVVVITSGTVAITLPAANSVPAGTQVLIKDGAGAASTNNITVKPLGADTLDAATFGAPKVISTNYGALRAISDGVSAWYVA